jgi:hypothetical protein
MIKHKFVALPAAALVVVSTQLVAQPVYKVVGKDGKVTYTNEMPPNVDGVKVNQVSIPAGGNAVAAVKSSKDPPNEHETVIRRRVPKPTKAESEVEAATRRLEEAKRALEAARQSASPDEWIYMNRPGIGRRRAPRPEYEERLKRMESDVSVAQEQLAEAERRQRRD